MRVEVIAGSPRRPSLNLRVARYLFRRLQETGEDVGLIALQDEVLPFVQTVWRRPEEAPAAFQSLALRMFRADAFVICSPEYNGAYSPALKNLFDHFPKQRRKAFGIVTSSDGALGGMRAAQQLLLMVPAFFGFASPQLLIVPKAHEKFDEDGVLLDRKFEKNCNDFVTEFLWLAHQLAR